MLLGSTFAPASSYASFFMFSDTDNIETETCGFFELNNLPKLSLTRNTKEQIQMCFEAYNNPSFKPKFD